MLTILFHLVFFVCVLSVNEVRRLSKVRIVFFVLVDSLSHCLSLTDACITVPKSRHQRRLAVFIGCNSSSESVGHLELTVLDPRHESLGRVK